MNVIFNTRIQLLLILVVLIISRLPQFLVEEIRLDGDECVVGLMAKHFIEGKELPIYFYGQAYGFSFLEVLFAGSSFMLFGVTALALKVGMLFFWTIGIVFFYFALKQIPKNKNSLLPLIFTLVLVCFPAWTVWATKARGGYVTAFVLSSIILYLFFKHEKNKLHYAIIGLLLVLIYESQLLWLAGIFPFLLFILIKDKSWKNVFILIISITIFGLTFWWIKSGIEVFWKPRVIGVDRFWENILELPRNAYTNFHGNFNYAIKGDPSFGSKYVSIAFLLMIPITILYTIYLYINKIKTNGFLIISTIAVMGTISYTFLLLKPDSIRYFMPLSGFVVLMVFFLFVEIKKVKYQHLALIWVLLGFSSMFNIKSHVAVNDSSVTKLIKVLNDYKIRYVYSTDYFLHWRLMFYSHEKILARHYPPDDRYPKYNEIIDREMQRSNNEVAIAGILQNISETQITGIDYKDNEHFVLFNPSKEKLQRVGFEFKKK